MNSVGGVEIREQRPSYVTFESKQVEDREETLKQGRYMAKSIDFAIVTPIGSKDRIPRQVDDWFAQLEQQTREGRVPASWLDQYRQAYQYWKRGETAPVNGTPIRGWPVISPAQQSNIIGATILTVEDLAQANDEARRRIGMGSQEVVDKAIAWLKAAKAHGPLTQENADLKNQLRALENQVNQQRIVIEQLKVENETLQGLVKLPVAA